jgi:tripartite ATP-independent transporter DctM subunit
MLSGAIGIGVLFLLLLMGVPIAFAMALVGFAGYAVVAGINPAMNLLTLVPYSTIAVYIFSILPLFLLMGEFTTHSGLMHDAYRAGQVWLGRLPGGLAMATIAGCAAFAAVCGESTSALTTTTKICLPEMLAYKYDVKLATGAIATGGTLSILIPPSVAFIIYGMIANQSVGRLFMAGIFPGILLFLLLAVTIYIMCRRNPSLGPPGPRASWRQRIMIIKDVWGVFLLFLLVMGGIWGGIFTPTEAAAVAVVVALLFALGRKRITRQKLISSLTGSARTSGMVFAIIIGAMIFVYFMSVSRFPAELTTFVTTLHVPPMGIIAAILLLYIFLGCILEPLSMTLLTVPIVVPIIIAIGFDPIWFGVLLVLMTELGLITPPVGMNVFFMAGMIKDVPISTLFKGIMPFIMPILVCVASVVAFPQIALFLPNTMMAMK